MGLLYGIAVVWLLALLGHLCRWRWGLDSESGNLETYLQRCLK